jgi:O-antigen ligase
MAALAGVLAGGGYGTPVLAVLAGGVLCAVAFRWPVAGAVLTLVVVATVFGENRLPSPHVSGVQIRISEILAVVSAAGALNRADPGRLRDLRAPLAWLSVFVMLSTAATALAVLRGSVTVYEAAQGYRPLVQLSLVLVVGLIAEERALRQLLDALLAVAAVVGIFAVAASAVPRVAALANDLASNSVGAPDEGPGLGALLRVRMPGLALCYALLLPGIAVLVANRGRGNVLRLGALVCMFAAIVVSFNRNQWVGSILATVVVVAIGSPAFRRRLVQFAVPLAIVAAIGFSTLLTRSEVSQAVMQRVQSLVEPTLVVQSESIRLRKVESRLALAAIERAPVTGIGPGKGYGNITRYGGQLNDTASVHNQYLEIALHYGIPALATFLAAIAVCLARGIGARLRPPQFHAFVATASVGSVMAILASSVVAMYLVPSHTLAALAVCLGLMIARPEPSSVGQAE